MAVDLDSLLAGLGGGLGAPAGPQMPANIAAIVKKAAKHRTKKEKNTLRAWQQSNARPQYSAPQTEYPPFLMELLGGEDYEPASDASLMMQASQMAAGQTAPGMAQIQQMLRGGTQAIQGLTQQVGARLAPVAGQVRGLYDAAQNQTSQVNQAMANRLQEMGMAQQGQLNQAFQAAGLEASQPLAAGVGDTAAAASQASFATGGSTLQRLAAEGAAAGTHAAALPGIASLGGQAAIAALAREAQVGAAGIAAQSAGAQQEAYRMLRSSEDARADAAADRKAELAGALMDWNQNKENIALQVYAANLSVFGDEQQARQAAAEYGVDTALGIAGMLQDQSQFDVNEAGENERFYAGLQADQDARDAAAAGDARSDRRTLENARDTYIDQWLGRARSRAESLSKGYMQEIPAANEYGDPTKERRYYTTKEAEERLTRLLGPMLTTGKARRFGLKQRLIDRLVSQSLQGVSGRFRAPLTPGRL